MTLSCRLCLATDPGENLNNVFQCNVQHVEDSLVDVLFWVFSVEIDVTDPFSKDICNECIQLIEYILQVKNTFQKNQENLRSYLQNESCNNLTTDSLNDGNIKKVSDTGQRSSSICTSPTSSPSKAQYNSKIYGNSSPRVRVALSSIEAMCPISINLEQLENTQEYLRYRQLKNGSFKRRKYRHFNMDGALLDDICSTLQNKKIVNTESLTREIGISTDECSFLSNTIKTDIRNVCTCYKDITSPLKALTVDNPSRETTDTKKNEDDDFLDIMNLTKSVDNTFLSPEGGREYDWTTLSFKKDASTNTKGTTLDTKDIGINATVHSTTTGTLTKRFKEMKKKNVVKVNIDSLKSFCPEVALEPLEDILDKLDYKKIDGFRYVKRGASSSQSIEENSMEHDGIKITQDPGSNCVQISKKQKFLDYYKNFSSFAVRELITGKKIRESDSEVFKIANVCSVFVCDFCSKSFLSNISLDMHYKRAHKKRNELDDVVIVDLLDSNGKTRSESTKLSRKMIRIRRRKPSGERTETIVNDNVVNVDCTSEGRTEIPANDMEGQSDNCSRTDSAGNIGLRKIKQKINYNVNDIMRLKTKGKQLPLNIKRRKVKLKRIATKNRVLVDKELERKNVSYIWDRKRLGKYSAISYYKNYSGEEKPPLLNLEQGDVKHVKQDLSLNETIQKLANRLDTSCTSDVNSSDKVD